MNSSGINPVNGMLVIAPDGGEEVSAGGVIIPAMRADRAKHGTRSGKVVAMAQDAFTYEDGKPLPERPELGQTVLFMRYAGGLFDGVDGEEYRMVHCEDVKGIINGV